MTTATKWITRILREFLSERRNSPSTRVRLQLVRLEDRLVLDAFRWTGAAGGDDFNWSNMNNWRVGDFIATRPPDVNDDVTFDNTGLQNSVVDANFTGTVRNITISQGYNRTITLQRNLIALGGQNSLMAGGTLTGNWSLTITSYPLLPPANFEWTGGTIAANVIIGVDATLNINGSGVKTLNGRIIEIEYGGVANWGGTGDIQLTNNGLINVYGTFNALQGDPANPSLYPEILGDNIPLPKSSFKSLMEAPSILLRPLT